MAALSIDTKESLPRTTTALQCAGWLTPPQSAHESRRPSLAYSSYSEMPYSAASTGTAFSLPSTPSRNVQKHARALAQPFMEDHINLDFSTALNGNQLTNDQLSQDLVHQNLDGQASCEMSQTASWPNHPVIQNAPDDYSSYFSEQAEPVWWEQQAPNGNFLQQLQPQQQPGLQTVLFPISHDLAAGHHGVPQTQMYDTAACSEFPDTATPRTHMQSPAIVEPFQMQRYPDNNRYMTNGSPSCSPQDMTSSFDSSLASSWEELRTPSPEVDYCHESDGFILVGDEDQAASPIATVDSKPIRTKRTRKGGKRRKAPFVPERIIRGTGVEITLEGESIAFENHRLVRTGNSSNANKKPFVCGKYTERGTACGRAFARSEHLKRHLGSHSSKRRFPCVLPACTKKIGRSDNACDHFRTHLQRDKANKRNKHFHWREVERRILHAYDPKTAAKILANLQRSLLIDMAKDSELRHAHDDAQYVQHNAELYVMEDYDDEDDNA